jgi:hypothetical protein
MRNSERGERRSFWGGEAAEGDRAAGDSGEFFDASLEQIVFGGGY